MPSTRGIALQAGKAYRLNAGGSMVWIEEVKPYPTGPLGVILPEQEDPEAYVMGIPGATRRRPIGCFARGEEVQLSDFNAKFVRDLPRLRKEGTEQVHPPRVTTPKSRSARRASGRSLACVRRYSFVKSNPKFKPGTQAGLIQSALQSLDKPTKQEIADACAKSPEWKWTADAAFKGARWYVDVLVREGFAKEID